MKGFGRSKGLNSLFNTFNGSNYGSFPGFISCLSLAQAWICMVTLYGPNSDILLRPKYVLRKSRQGGPVILSNIFPPVNSYPYLSNSRIRFRRTSSNVGSP
jgi:hypothetical protein